MKKFALLVLTFILLIGCSDLSENETAEAEEGPDAELEVENSDEDIEEEAVDEDGSEVTVKEASSDESEDVSGNLSVHFIDVGQGDATLLKAVEDGETYSMLIDAGDWTGDEVVPYLNSQAVDSIDLVIGTHIHADHIGQLDAVLGEFPVEEVWMTGNVHTTNVFEDVVEALEASDAAYYEPRSGDEVAVGPLNVQVYHPSELSGDFNNDSISVRVTYGEVSFLFTGDAEAGAEDEMLSAGFDLKADIFQLGHHGSSTSNTPAFMGAVSPDVAIYSAGADNDYGHPHYEVVEYVNGAGIELYGTDVHGTVVVETDGQVFSIETGREGTVEKEKPDFLKENDEVSQSNGECIDINSASKEELQEIIHIGEERVEELIELRPHNTLNGLKRIYGIGDGRLDDIKEEGLACVN